MTRVLVTGLGSVSALGFGARRLLAALIAGESGIGPLSAPLAETTKVGLAAEINGYVPGDHFPAADLPLLDRFSQYALIAAREAVAGRIADPGAIAGRGLGPGYRLWGKRDR